MLITRRQRRRVLLALLPLLAFVWAALPALPCCHESGVATSDTVMTAMFEHAGHHENASVDGGFAVDHGTNHCEEGSVLPPDPPCTDIQKTSNDLRPVHFAAASVVLTSLVPVLQVEPSARPPLPDPSPPPRHRPLHLEKSVLLI